MPQETLKPCPMFIKHHPRVTQVDRNKWAVICDHDTCPTRTLYAKTKELAIAKWNRMVK